MDKKLILIFLVFVMGIFAGLSVLSSADIHTIPINKTNIDENGQYCTANDVASYIKTFHKLPSNYITKKDAQSLGWNGRPLKSMHQAKALVEIHLQIDKAYYQKAMINMWNAILMPMGRLAVAKE